MFLSELQTKDIVSIKDGRKVGRIIDVKIDEQGKIEYFVIEQKRGLKNFMSSTNESNIAYNYIEKIGSDVILVNLWYNKLSQGDYMNRKIFIIAIFALLIDQISKIVIGLYFKLNESIAILKNFFSITLVHNTGAAWSILQNKNILIIIFSIIALVIIYRFMFLFKTNKRNNLAFGLLVGGVFGNMLDRIIYGYVRDFFDFTIFSYDYPVFNVADIFIVVGVILLIIAIIKGEDSSANSSRRRKHKNW